MELILQSIDTAKWGAFSMVIIILVLAIRFLKAENEALKKEHLIEKKSLQEKIDGLVADSHEDLRAFSADKSKTIFDITTILTKHSYMLDQIKSLVHDKR
jgi:hypothetical protein